MCVVPGDTLPNFKLARFNGDGPPETPLFRELKADVKASGARLVVLDPLANLYEGDYYGRNDVPQFMAMLRAFAREIDGAVLLNAHPSRAGMVKSNDLHDGTTAWNNSARSRWSLSRPTTKLRRKKRTRNGAPPDLGAEEPVDPDGRVLTHNKANYARAAQTIKLVWARGMLLTPEAAARGPSRRETVEETFMRFLRDAIASRHPVSASVKARDWYAPKAFAHRATEEGLEISLDAFEATMTQLLTKGKILLASDSRRKAALVIAGEDGAWFADEVD